MPGLIDLGKVDTDFAASLAEASKAVDEEVADDDVDTDESEEASDDADDGASDDADDADDDGDDDESAEDDEADESVPELASVGQLFVDGDLASACKALGIDPKIFKVNEAKFKAMRAGLKEANEKSVAAEQATRANAAEKTRLDAVLADAKREYGPLVDLKAAVGLGDFGTIQELLIALAPKGTSWETIKAGLDNAGKGVSAGELAARRELKRLKDEQAARDAEAAKQKTTTDEAALRQKNIEGATTRLKGTEFEGVPGAAEALVRIYAENWNYERGGLKIKAEETLKLLAADPVIGGLLELKKLKAGKAAPAKKKVRRQRGRGAVAEGNERKPDPKAKAERERQAAMAEASRMEKNAQRAGRRGMRGLR